MKTCTKCGVEKPDGDFYKAKRVKSGFHSECKTCHKICSQASRRKNKKGRAKYEWKRRKGSRFNQSLICARSRAKKDDHEPCNATTKELKAAFTGFCDVCGVPELECDRKLHMDHCHITGELRGFLCRSCNLGLGFFKDSDDILLSAMKYMAKHDTNKKVI